MMRGMADLGPWIISALALIVTLGAYIFGGGRFSGAAVAKLESAFNRAEEALAKAHKVEEGAQIRIDPVHGQVELLRSNIFTELKDTTNKVSEAVLLVAREHPTNKDLREFRDEIKTDIRERFGELKDDIADIHSFFTPAATQVKKRPAKRATKRAA